MTRVLVLEHEHGEKLRVRSALRWQILRPIFFLPNPAH